MTSTALRSRGPASGHRRALVASNQVYLALGLTRAELQDLELRDRLRLEDLAGGRGTTEAINELRQAATLSGRLAALGFGDAADAAAAEAALAHADHGDVGADLVAVVARLLDHLAAQRAAASRGRVLQALGLVGWR
jgi:hypothetical protein